MKEDPLPRLYWLQICAVQHTVSCWTTTTSPVSGLMRWRQAADARLHANISILPFWMWHNQCTKHPNAPEFLYGVKCGKQPERGTSSKHDVLKHAAERFVETFAKGGRRKLNEPENYYINWSLCVQELGYYFQVRGRSAPPSTIYHKSQGTWLITSLPLQANIIHRLSSSRELRRRWTKGGATLGCLLWEGAWGFVVPHSTKLKCHSCQVNKQLSSSYWKKRFSISNATKNNQPLSSHDSFW